MWRVVRFASRRRTGGGHLGCDDGEGDGELHLSNRCTCFRRRPARHRSALSARVEGTVGSS